MYDVLPILIHKNDLHFAFKEEEEGKKRLNQTDRRRGFIARYLWGARDTLVSCYLVVDNDLFGLYDC